MASHAPEPDKGPLNVDAGSVRVRRARVWRVLFGLGAGLIALLVLVVIGICWLGAHLDQPSVKARIQALAQQHAGLSIDYDALELSPFRGVHVRSFRVLQPPRFRAAAQDFVRVDDFDVRARTLALAWGARTLDSLQIGALEVTLVRDDSGATTLSELFPSKPTAQASNPAPQTKLSQSLASLPEIALDQLRVDAIRAKQIELHAAGPSRVTTLASFAISGAVHSAPHSLRGTALQLNARPALRFEMREGDALQYADLGFAFAVRSDSAEAVALRVHIDLRDQNILPDWKKATELVNLDTRLSFDESAGQTSISCSDFRGLGGMLAAAVGVEVFDTEPLRVLANGKASVDVDRLPVEVDGVTLDALKLALEAKQFSWQGDRIAGSIDWHGGVRELTFAKADQRAQLRELSLDGQGKFEGPSGNLVASARIAELASQSPSAKAQLANLILNLKGETQNQPSGGQKANAELTLILPNANVSTSSGQTFAIDGVKFDSSVRGSVADFAAKLITKLDGKLELTELRAADGGKQHTTLQNLSIAVSGENLAVDQTGEPNARGTANMTVALPTLRVFAGPITKQARGKSGHALRGATLAVDDLNVHADLPLSLAHVTGGASLATLVAQDNVLKGLQLELDLQTPLAWSADRTGPAQARISGHVASLRAADSRAVIDDLQLVASRLSKDRYRLELSNATSSLVLKGKALPGRITSELHADIAPAAGNVAASASLRGARGAAVDLKLDAGFTSPGDRLHYDVDLSAEKLDAFASLIYGAAPSAAGVKVEGAHFRASARGDFTGVLKADRSGTPTLVVDPIATARGEQSFGLELSGLDYHGADRSLVIPELTFKLDSVHGDAGAGSANASFRADSLQYDGAGTTLHLTGLNQTVVATYDRAPDQGVVDVRSNLELGSAAQSIFPAYPIAGLHFATRVQIDRLRSIFLREFSLENQETGTKLHAQGALELRTKGAQEERKTLVGREALALSGSLQQTLTTFEKLGFMARARGDIEMPFRLESGGLLGYRLIASVQAKQVSITTKDRAFGVEDLNGVIPLVEEFALLPGGPVLSAGPRASPLSETRFFDVHPFLSGNDYVTARSISLRGLQPLGPLAANVRLERSDFLIDQLQVGFNAGQIVGQVRIAYRDGDPLVRMRLDATGIRSANSSDVFDANAALSFVPNAMTLDGKVQLVRVSRAHLLGILDVVDPFHESASANRIRSGLTFGYPKFVRFQLHDGALDTKVELGGLVKFVRIDEIKAVPLGPILQRYVAPSLAGYLHAGPTKNPTPLAAANAEESE